MAALPYAPTSWSDNEPILTDKLRQMSNNDQYLFEQLSTVYYNANAIKKTSGMKIMASTVSVSPNLSSPNGMATFYFGTFFTVGCKPMVIASINSYPQGRFHLNTRGIGTFWPDHRGFEVRIAADELNTANNKIYNRVWVMFIAMGF